ncbi:MAG: hypothetical protein AB7P07_14525 [Hyphomonadaceae bacterium]
MNRRLWPLATLLFGIATLAAFLGLGAQPAVRAAYEPDLVSTAVSVFQRAESLSDLVRVFGAPPNPAIIHAQNAINTLDLSAFIPAYALFLVAAAIMIGGWRNRWAQAAIVFGLLGAAADVMETWKQLQIGAIFAADSLAAEEFLPLAPWHWLKYLALALNGLAVATLFVTAGRKHWLLAAIAAAPLPLVGAAYLDALSTRTFASAFALYWIALLLLAAWRTIRPPPQPAAS